MGKRHPMEMSRGNILIHVAPMKDGTFHGEDVYNGKRGGLRFRNFGHLKSFSLKHNYNLRRIRNT